MNVAKEKNQLSKIIKSEELYSQFFSVLPVGIVLVDDKLQVVEANDYICKIFGRGPIDDIEQLFGNAFNCAFATEKGQICSENTECDSCLIRKNLIKLMDSETNLLEVEFNYHFMFNGRKTNKWFMMNAASITMAGKEHALIALMDISKRKQIESELIEIGVTDSLTGLYNRRYIDRQLKGLISSLNDESPVCVAMLDIDNFKRVNDSFGHVTGDVVLKGLAEVLKDSLRDNDQIGRYGGDEFLVVLRKSNLASSKKVMERIAKSYEKLCMELLNQPVTFSVGLLEITQKDLANFEILKVIDKVDKLLYKAKAKGKNRIEI